MPERLLIKHFGDGSGAQFSVNISLHFRRMPAEGPLEVLNHGAVEPFVLVEPKRAVLCRDLHDAHRNGGVEVDGFLVKVIRTTDSGRAYDRLARFDADGQG